MNSNSYKDFDLNFLIKTSLNEDIQTGDITSLSCIDENSKSTAILLVKQNGIVCGKEIVDKILQKFDENISIKWYINDGDFVVSKTIIAELKGNTRSILTVERTILNFFQRMSGVATLTNLYVEKIAHTKATILDTRKTIPGYRYLDKYAVKCGGGTNHRFGLYDMVMIKDNHIAANKSISNAVFRCVEYLNKYKLQIPIEVETKNIEEVKEALDCNHIQRIMFDNFDLNTLNVAVQIVDGKKETEASGGVNLNTIKDIAETGVQFISVGAITHSALALDVSLDLI